jgi:hypothetical protein
VARVGDDDGKAKYNILDIKGLRVEAKMPEDEGPSGIKRDGVTGCEIDGQKQVEHVTVIPTAQALFPSTASLSYQSSCPVSSASQRYQSLPFFQSPSLFISRLLLSLQTKAVYEPISS